MEKFKKILLYILVYVVALAVGGVLAAIGEKITALGFLSTAMDWGFDTIHLNLKVINLALALQFHIFSLHPRSWANSPADCCKSYTFFPDFFG